MGKKTKTGKKITSLARPSLHGNWLKITLVSLIIILFCLHIALTAYLLATVSIMKRTTDPLVIRSMVFSAVDGLRKSSPVDFRTGDNYFPEARIFVPNNQLAHTLLYSYTPASKSDSGEIFDEELTVTSESIMSRSKLPIMSAEGIGSVFEFIPQMQACNRAFVIKFVDTKPQFSETTLQAKASLDDGRTAYIFKDVGCKVDTNDLQSALLKARSFM